jgi:hypothetical protein
MNPRTLRRLAAAVVFTAALPAFAAAQTAPPALPAVVNPPAQPAPALTQAQLDQLVAPVALYPDVLLSPILAAATYPLEIVEAHRWVTQPDVAALNGEALAAAAANQDWDPSVQALTRFPQILEMMDTHLDWTERLGEAFLAQPADVMAAVQRLRHRAQAAGTLQLSTQQSVVNEGGDIAIASAAPQEIYLPTYNPWCAYGPWPDAPQAPYYFTAYQGDCYPGDDYVGYDAGIFLPYGYLPWGDFDWRHHQIRLHRDGFGQLAEGEIWHHDPAHRLGVRYRDPRNASKFHTVRPPGERYAYAPPEGYGAPRFTGFAPHGALFRPAQALGVGARPRQFAAPSATHAASHGAGGGSHGGGVH